jgi:hypothetical protein
VTLDFAIARINQLDKPTAWADGWTFRPGQGLGYLVYEAHYTARERMGFAVSC